MPKIQTYERRVENQGPIQGRRMTAEDVGGGEGLAMLGKGLSTVTDVLYQREQQVETSDLSAKMAKLQADKQIEWGDRLRKADPNDRDLAKKFTEDFNKAAEALGEGIQTSAGRRFFEERKAQLSAHFQTTTNAGMVELAAVKAGQDFNTTLNSHSTAVRADPTAYESNLAGLSTSINALVATKGLDRTTALKLETASREQLAKDAVHGWIEKDPAFAKKMLDDGKWDTQFDGAVKQQLYGAVDQEIRGREAEAARQRAEQERILKAQQEETKKGFLDKVQKGSLSYREISKSNLDAADREHYTNLIKAAAEKPLKTDYRVFRDILERISLPEGDPRKITDEKMITQKTIEGLLDVSDTKFLRDEFNGRNTDAGRRESDAKRAFLDGYKSSITNSVVGKNDVVGDQRFAEFAIFVAEAEARRRQEGKPVADLYNSNSDAFLGKYAPQYQRSVKEQMQDYAKSMRRGSQPRGQDLLAPGATPPPKSKPVRNPGESPADFIKRTGG